MNYLGDVVPSALEHARTRVALTRDELVEKINRILKRMGEDLISGCDVDSWESGGRGMTWSEAYAFTKVTMSPFNALFQTQPPPEPLTDFRSPPGGRARPLDYKSHRYLFQFNNCYEMVKELGARLGDSEQYNVPVANNQTVQDAARLIRDALGVTPEVQSAWANDAEAIDEWTKRVNNCGVFVFNLPFNIDVLRGVARWDDGGPPAIALSTQDWSSAKVFTLVHEFAHLTHSRSDGFVCDPRSVGHASENRMNKIAAETTVPEQWVRQVASGLEFADTFKDSPRNTRAHLTRTFKVSNQALGIRLAELGIVRESGYAQSGFEPRKFGASMKAGRTSPSTAQRFKNYLGPKAIDQITRALHSGAVGEGELLKHYLQSLKLKDLWELVD